ncbi:hypothetical protein MIMGU_mgv1a026650mg, partial [Erythranthe guttata]
MVLQTTTLDRRKSVWSKRPFFKPYQITPACVKNIHDNKTDIIRTIQSQLSRLKATTSNSRHPIAPDTPTSRINTLSNDSDVSNAIDQFQESQNEINPISILQQMTMAVDAYKIQYGTLDKTIAELLVAGFSGQLKGWWDHYLTNQEQIQIIDAIKTDEEGNIILDEEDNPQQDVVATLILTISLHIIGDPSQKDINVELLPTLRCRKLSDFQNNKNTFPSKVRNKIRETSGKQIIQYNEFTYGQLVSTTQEEGLKIFQDLKIQQNLKNELKRSKQELGTFCQQFDIGSNKPSKDCNGECVRTRNLNKNPRKSNEEYYKISGQDTTTEIGLSEDILNKLFAILIDSSDTDESPNVENFTSNENRACQVDEKVSSSEETDPEIEI